MNANKYLCDWFLDHLDTIIFRLELILPKRWLQMIHDATNNRSRRKKKKKKKGLRKEKETKRIRIAK